MGVDLVIVVGFVNFFNSVCLVEVVFEYGVKVVYCVDYVEEIW